MPETTYPYAGAHPRAGAASYGALLAQTMFLVTVALVFVAGGSYVGQDLGGSGFGFTIGAVVLLIASNFVPALRHGALGIGVLFVAALLLGLGLGPIIAAYAQVNSPVVAQAAGTTALIVAGAGTAGSLVAKDLRSWMKPLSIVALIAIVLSWGMFLFGAGGGTAGLALSGVIGVVMAGLILVYFNYLRKHATEDDVVMLATGIFLGIYNIFVVLLNIFGSR